MLFNATGSLGRTNERIMLAKQTARMRQVMEGRQLTEKLRGQYRKVNDGVRDGLIAEARKDASKQAQDRIDLLEAASRWEAVVTDMNRLIEAGGDQARLGAGR